MKSLLALTFGLVLGYSVITYAQTTYLPAVDNTVCWDQTGVLATINAWKVRVTYNTQAAQAVNFTCAGTVSPFQCKLATAVPMSLQTGTLSVKVEGAAVNPDSTLTAYSTLITGNLVFGTPAPVPPANSGSNLRIVKLVEALLAFLRNAFSRG